LANGRLADDDRAAETRRSRGGRPHSETREKEKIRKRGERELRRIGRMERRENGGKKGPMAKQRGWRRVIR